MPTRKRRFSPLTLRVLAVNALALAVLAGSLLYVGHYKDRLIDTELDALALEARIFAAAMAEGATTIDKNGDDMLAPSLARQMVRRLAEASDAHTRLFTTAGALLADSHSLVHPGGRVQVEPLTPPNANDAADEASQLQHVWNSIWPWFVIDVENYPLYTEGPNARADQYPEVMAAGEGAASTRVWRTRKGALILSAATPIQRYKQVLGMLSLTRDGSKIEAAISSVQIDILKFFFATLTVTTLLSFYLARTITRPIWRLAAAAERVRSGGQGRDKEEIPDFTARADEIGDLSGALRAMTQDLWARLDAIDHFAADVAHEIKNPLTSMKSAIETIGRVKEAEVRDKMLAIVLDDIGRLDRLISDISSASRLDAELSRAEMQNVDLDSMLSTLADFYASQAGADTRVVIRYERDGGERLAAPVIGEDTVPPPTRLMVKGLDGRLVQVFRNLVDNAVSFSPEGGKVLMTAGRGEEPNTITVTVDDWGPGIPETSTETIFDRFYSERPAGEKFGTHSGLGLSISKQIIAAHHGRIFALNRRNEHGHVLGARFTVILEAA